LHSFCRRNKLDLYSEKVGERYIEAKRIAVCKAALRNYRLAIRRLNCTLTGEEWKPAKPPDKAPIKTCFDDCIGNYKMYLIQTGKIRKDVRRRISVLTNFLSYAEQTGCSTLSDLSAGCIHGGFQAATTKISFRTFVGAFLRYAYTYKLIGTDLSLAIPTVATHTAVPSVYSPEEIEMLLASIDRRTELGKRNYAIILIAARLGLRASDISAMTFDSLHKEKGTVEIVQKKTKTPLTLPLTDEIGKALNDYIENGRPQSDEEHIFLNFRGYGVPLPATVGWIVEDAFEQSGIDRKGRRRGSHSLRASLATALLAEGNDFYTIQRTLGQQSVQSTKTYAKADVENLRVNAMPVPPPKDNFEILLKEGNYRNEKLCVLKRVSPRTE
jgi:site-specific recombinase XerD